MATMIGELARRAALLNPNLGEEVLEETPGVVLIDELDLHLHPKWQRRIIHDLKRTFPQVQFIATTHSPQLIGEARPHEVRILEEGKVYSPPHSFGLDSSRVLGEIQGASERDPEIESRIHRIAEVIDAERFDEARQLISSLEEQIGKDDAEIVRARSLINFMEAPI
jgi:predicted ATP-binding protein involved in virulence